MILGYRGRRRVRELDAAVHRKIKLRRWRRYMSASGLEVSPLAVEIVNNFNSGGNSLGQRAWPEVSGYPPVFGNFIGEIAHTAGGSYIWTGFSWEPAILGG